MYLAEPGEHDFGDKRHRRCFECKHTGAPIKFKIASIQIYIVSSKLFELRKFLGQV
jgi:hypothetical protein